MKKSIIATVIASLLIGVAGGYGSGYIIYEPKIRSYEIQVSDLTFEVSRLSQAVSNQEARISTLESEKSTLQTVLSRAQAQTQVYKEQITALESQLSNVQRRLDNILGITVTQHYDWIYQWETWKWDLPIPLSLYVEYLERSRPQSPSYWVDMAKDSKDDPYINQMVQRINDAALKKRYTEVQKLNFVIAFVQNLPYTVDIETTPYDEYPRYPLETLFDRGGDCEDTSILVAALLDRMGYDVALLLLENARHMAVGVSLSGAYGSYYEYDSKKYFYLETTGEGWVIGQIPPSITDVTAYVYPIRG